MIYMLIGPSSSGKDTFFEYILKNYNLDPIILHTTRPKRVGEVEGKTYFFVSKEQLDELEKNNKLVERRNYKVIDGIWSYATCADKIDLTKNLITLNTWEGYSKFLDYYGKKYLTPIYFELDKGVRLQRALNREMKQENPKYEEMCRRFLADNIDYDEEKIKLYNPYIIDNNSTMDNTEKQIDKVLKKIKKV